MNFKKAGITLTTAALSLGLVTSAVSAQTPDNGQPQQLQIQVATTENIVTKEDLIKKFKAFFPNEFNFLTSNDFYMSNGHRFPGEEIIRYDLSFHKTIQGKSVHGGVTFAGEDLEIESFYYQPANQAEALFPAKVSKEDAQKIAQQFLKKFPDSEQYQLNANLDNQYFYPNQVLTEPISYNFSFSKTNKDIKISDHHMQITVLGNGEVTQFYRNPVNRKSYTFDEPKNVKAIDQVTKKVTDNLAVQLQYQINHDYQTNKQSVQLVYLPTEQFIGVHGLTEDWYTASGLTKTLPETKKIEKIVSAPLPPKKEGMTLEDAKKFANDLLKIDSEDVTLTINNINEMTNYTGREVFVIDYSYEYKNGGYGTSLEIDKQTGEIVQYHDLKNDVLNEVDTNKDKKPITGEQALTKAISYLKEWAPSNLHHYAKPLKDPYYEKVMKTYTFAFPRVVNGIAVAGDEINVTITADGTLSHLYVNYQDINDWPSLEGIISPEEAKKRFVEDMELELQYMKINEEEKHYSLVYFPTYNNNSASSLDATNGQWLNYFEKEGISNPDSTSEELNYLIQNNILEVKDLNSFNAEDKVSAGEALKVLVKSLTYFYESHYPEQGESPQTFENIKPDHPYYNVVERAAAMGIIDVTKDSFNTDEMVTREQLAVWYIRALGLEEAAKHKEIFKVDVSDADDITHTGYVALANAIGVLPVENGRFNPKKEVTYAELATSTIRLAHKAYESGVNHYY